MSFDVVQKMKTIATHILSAFAVLSVALGDDARNEVAIVTVPADDYVSICGSDIAGRREYSVCLIDLDGDGRKDQMFANAATSGTGGKAATIYLARDDERFTRIGTILHQGLATEKIKTGGVLLYCSSSGGRGHSSISTFLLSHNGLKEVMTQKGEWKNAEYSKIFEKVFVHSLKYEYKQITLPAKE